MEGSGNCPHFPGVAWTCFLEMVEKAGGRSQGRDGEAGMLKVWGPGLLAGINPKSRDKHLGRAFGICCGKSREVV